MTRPVRRTRPRMHAHHGIVLRAVRHTQALDARCCGDMGERQPIVLAAHPPGWLHHSAHSPALWFPPPALALSPQYDARSTHVDVSVSCEGKVGHSIGVVPPPVNR